MRAERQRRRDRQTDRQIGRKGGRQASREAGRQAGRQTGTEGRPARKRTHDREIVINRRITTKLPLKLKNHVRNPKLKQRRDKRWYSAQTAYQSRKKERKTGVKKWKEGKAQCKQ